MVPRNSEWCLNSMPPRIELAVSNLWIPALVPQKSLGEMIEIESEMIDAGLITTIVDLRGSDEGEEAATGALIEPKPLGPRLFGEERGENRG